jgi:hypothetical protein
MATSTSRATRRFLPIILLMPTLKSAIGIDGGAMFQLLAIEDLRLSPTQIGVAFGLGVLSLPVQVWAARIPLWRARRNLRIFLVVAAVQAWLLAALVAAGAGSFAVGALAVTVTAEISLSVLYATSLQPLMSSALSSAERQRMNARARAFGGMILIVALVAFAASGATARVAFLVAIGAVAAWVALDLRRLSAPTVEAPSTDGATRSAEPLTPQMRSIYLAVGILNFGAMPLLLVYVGDALWPGGNLGLVGALQIGGALLASLAWRTSAASLFPRLHGCAIAVLAATLCLAALQDPQRHRAEQVALLLIVVVSAAATTTIQLGLMELTHRSVEQRSSVRAFALLDVVESTSLQVGLLIGGVLIALSRRTPDWPVDPYRTFLVVTAVAAVAALSRVRRAPAPVAPL